MSPTEIIETIERLRAMGARRCRVADVEVEFADAARAAEPPPRIPPDELERRRKEAEDDLMFAASG